MESLEGLWLHENDLDGEVVLVQPVPAILSSIPTYPLYSPVRSFVTSFAVRILVFLSNRSLSNQRHNYGGLCS